jgi:type II secretory pathway pseudopilin PulG
VVIIILTTLVSAAIPIMAPTNDDRRLREASRSVNAFISAAQMKAVQTQRPVGVALKRLSQDTNSNPNQVHDDNAVCIELYYVEQPAPYRGFDRTSSAMVARHPNSNRPGQVLIQFVVRSNTTGSSLPIGWNADLFPPYLVRPGDVVEIDGTRYRLLNLNVPVPSWAGVQLSVETTNGYYTQRDNSRAVSIEAVPLNDTGQMLNIAFDADGRKLRDPIVSGSSTRDAPFWTNPAPYKILRQPKFTSAEPFQMPEGTAIDLRASGQAIEINGTGPSQTATGFFYNPDVPLADEEDRVDNSDPIIIMFTPEGSVERVQFNQSNVGISEAPEIFDAHTVSNLYLLIGRRENAPPPAADATVDKTLDPMYPSLTDQQKQEVKETVNWLRGESRWIVIGSQSGRVVTVENAFVDPGQFLPPMEPEDIIRARQIDASREFAREMVQVGGR